MILRTAGFNSIDIGAMNDSTWLGMDVFMFIGGGSAGTAGGIKVTTFALLFFVIWPRSAGNRRPPCSGGGWTPGRSGRR